jgi:hypothetical protein
MPLFSFVKNTKSDFFFTTLNTPNDLNTLHVLPAMINIIKIIANITERIS